MAFDQGFFDLYPDILDPIQSNGRYSERNCEVSAYCREVNAARDKEDASRALCFASCILLAIVVLLWLT
jgi:hypothetical protein